MHSTGHISDHRDPGWPAETGKAPGFDSVTQGARQFPDCQLAKNVWILETRFESGQISALFPGVCIRPMKAMLNV